MNLIKASLSRWCMDWFSADEFEVGFSWSYNNRQLRWFSPGKRDYIHVGRREDSRWDGCDQQSRETNGNRNVKPFYKHEAKLWMRNPDELFFEIALDTEICFLCCSFLDNLFYFSFVTLAKSDLHKFYLGALDFLIFEGC